MTTVTESPTIAIVLVNWNNEGDTAECLASLAEQTYDDFCVIVVDNGSKQESIDSLTERFSWPVYIRNEENRGFTGGNNPGIERALEMDAEWVFLLNNDTVVEQTFLEDLIGAASDLTDNAGVVGPLIHTYQTEDVWAAGGKLSPITGKTAHRVGDAESYEKPERVDYVVGAAMLVRAEVFEEVGILDNDFFIYYEETEFCRRVDCTAWEIWYVPVTGVKHKESVEYEFSTFREYYFTRNKWFFIQKTSPIYFRLFFYPYFIIRWVFSQVAYLLVINRNPAAAWMTLQGALHAVLGRSGKLSD